MYAACRQRGFTLLELSLALGVVAVLSAIALPLYQRYVERAGLAQLLTQIDQISTSVQIEDATGVKALQRDAEPGKAPPGLRVVPDSAFSEPGGIRLTLIRAPAGFFASSPEQDRYGLVADLTGSGTVSRLAELRRALPFGPGDKLWLGAGQLAFPLVARADPGAAPPTPPTPVETRWEGQALPGPNNTWSCLAKLNVFGTDALPLHDVNAGMRVKVIMEVTTWAGQAITRSWNDLGNISNGAASFRMDRLSASGSSGEVVTACRLEVLGIDYYWPRDPAVPWDGKLATIRVPMPGGKS